MLVGSSGGSGGYGAATPVAVAWTPVIQAFTGSVTSYTIHSSSAWRIGKLVLLQIDFTYVSGTATSYLYFNAPSLAAHRPLLTGIDTSTLTALMATTTNSRDTFYVANYAGGSGIFSGNRYRLNGTYEEP